mgnify:CR=1 FL=1
MLLKDCPIGSIVRLVSLGGEVNDISYWLGEFEVFNDNEENFVIDRDGDKRFGISDDPHFQFEVVSPSYRTLTLSGTTYTLTPYEEPKLVTIDDVVYVMTEVK